MRTPDGGQRVKLGYMYVKVHKYTKFYYNLKQKNNYCVSITTKDYHLLIQINISKLS